MTDPRYLAVKLLDKTFSGGSYSNLQLDSGLKGSDLDAAESFAPHYTTESSSGS